MTNRPEIPALYKRELVHNDSFRLLRGAREFIAEHLDSSVRLEDAAAVASMSPFHFHRMFVRAFGETPNEFRTRLRIERAQTLLRSGDLTVSEVCFEVGYESLGSFSALFTRMCGCPPSEFRRVFSFEGFWRLKVVPACFGQKFGFYGEQQDSRSDLLIPADKMEIS